MTYYINNDQAGYKIEYPFSHIKNIYLENGDADMGKSGGLVVELNRPPNFFMDSSGSGGFFQCGDFTEDQQASAVMLHHLGGHPKVLSGQLAKLVSLDSFMNRHDPFDHQQLSVSAPVSPTGHRPASQPNYNAQAHVGMFQEQWGIGVHPSARGPGHKRQRSRSVPMAVDFSMLILLCHPSSSNIRSIVSLTATIPTFSLQFLNSQTLWDLWARICGSILLQATVWTLGSILCQLRQLPPIRLCEPFVLLPGPRHQRHARFVTILHTLSHISPLWLTHQIWRLRPCRLSFMSHGDPAIVDQSPPLSMMHRSSSADVYNMGHDHHSNISDDGTGLNEMYSKHRLTLPMHSHSPSPAFVEQSQADMDMNQLVQFDTIDPSSLSPEGPTSH